MRTSRSSRVFTVSFPEDLAKQVDLIAKQESRNISELFRQAFRTYQVEAAQRKLISARAAASLRSAKNFGKEDVEPLVDEIRTEFSRSRKA